MAGDAVFAGSLVGRYDAVLGPFMFEPFARVTAERLAGVSGDVLEIAAGTGVVTRELDRALAPDATLMATDLIRPMLARAAERLNSPRVSWRQADAPGLAVRGRELRRCGLPVRRDVLPRPGGRPP